MNETIVSLSSGAIKAAISLIRLSGGNSFDILRKFFSVKKDKYEHHKLYYGYVLDENETVDEVVVSIFVAPNSFTAEDMVEISCHGSMYIVRRIIELCIKHGARLARRGEFSQRAFLSGRIDLVKAEAINDLINASTKQAAALAMSGLKGLTSKYVSDLSEKLLDVISHIEVNIDYPEYDDIEELMHLSVIEKIDEMLLLLEKVIDDTKRGQVVKNGIDTIIVGKPNVGKSSLLNALLKEDKAIVTDIAGTTRDIVEGKIDFDGITLNLIDTAGVRKSDNLIEEIGIKKTLEFLKKAQLVLLVLDNNQGLTEEDKKLLELTKNQTRIIIINKIDLTHKNKIDIPEAIRISVLNNDLKQLEEKIKELFKDFNYNDEPLLFNARQLGLLSKAKEHLIEAKNQALNQQVIDLISIDISEAYHCILEILGKVNKVDLLDNIFSKFCLGK